MDDLTGWRGNAMNLAMCRQGLLVLGIELINIIPDGTETFSVLTFWLIVRIYGP